MALTDKLDKQIAAEAKFLRIDPDDQGRFEEACAPFLIADFVPAHAPPAFEETMGRAMDDVQSAGRAGEIAEGAEVVGFYKGHAVVCVGWKHSKAADDDTLRIARPRPPAPVQPPQDDAFVAVGSTRFSDGKEQTAESLADAEKAWDAKGAPRNVSGLG